MIWKYISELDAQISQNLKPITKWLMYVGCIFFLLRLLIRPFFGSADFLIEQWLATSVDRTIFHGNIWQVFTYPIVHIEFLNLLFNMFAIYFFGLRLEERWGSKNLLRFTLLMIVFTGLIHLAVCAAFGNILDSLTGFSGLVFGILFAMAWYYPDDIVYFQMLFPIKIKYLVAVIAFMTFLSGAGSGSNLSHLTPLGGFLAAFLYVKFPAFFESIPVPWPGRRTAKVRDINRNRRF